MAALHRDYVEAGSYALRQFLEASGANAGSLAWAVDEYRDRYESIRENSLAIGALDQRTEAEIGRTQHQCRNADGVAHSGHRGLARRARGFRRAPFPRSSIIAIPA